MAGIWEEKSTAIHYADYSFIMTRHQLKQETLSSQDASATDVSAGTAAAAAAAADTKPTTQETDDEDSCKSQLALTFETVAPYHGVIGNI